MSETGVFIFLAGFFIYKIFLFLLKNRVFSIIVIVYIFE